MGADEHRYENGMTAETLNALTEKIIACAFKVSNALGTGVLEKVYENALAHELRKNAHDVMQQDPVEVSYDGLVVRRFESDLIVDGMVILEIKATREHHDIFEACCLNYLAATRLPVCLLLNFGKPRLSVKRFVGQSFR
jgi:GxxExxY protein